MTDGGPDATARRRGHPVLRYTALRLVMFLAVLALLWVFPALRGLLAIILALLISGMVSLFVLDRQRDSMSSAVTGFFGRINERIEASTRAEDIDDPADVDAPEVVDGPQDGDAAEVVADPEPPSAGTPADAGPPETTPPVSDR